MNVLGIETSCDETGVAVVHAGASGTPRLLAHALHSQVEMHSAYGGVVPELASRDHIRRVLPLAREVLARSELALDRLDAVAYTRGPGLAGALLVTETAAIEIARGRWTIPDAGRHFGVSTPMIQFRINKTGATRRVQRARAAAARSRF